MKAYRPVPTPTTVASGEETTARRSGYEESHPYSDGDAELLRAFHERPYLDGNVRKDAGWTESGSERIRYEDRYYDYRLRFESA